MIRGVDIVGPTHARHGQRPHEGTSAMKILWFSEAKRHSCFNPAVNVVK